MYTMKDNKEKKITLWTFRYCSSAERVDNIKYSFYSRTSSKIEEIQKVVVAELESDFFIEVNNTVFFHMYNKLCAIECLEIE